jgi:L-lactate permease
MLPLAFLLAVTLIRRISLPCSTSLPIAAALLALVRLTYLASAPVSVLGSCVRGLLEGITPLSVIFGAIVLFEAMQHSRVSAAGCLDHTTGDSRVQHFVVQPRLSA